MRRTKQNIKWDSLINFAWFSCQYSAEKLRYTRHLNQKITSEREKKTQIQMSLVWSKFVHQSFFSFWKVMANSLRDCIELVGTWYIPSVEGWLRRGWIQERKGRWVGLKRLEWNTFADAVTITCWTTIIHVSAGPFPRPSETVCFRQQNWKLPQRVKVNFYCTGTRTIPHSPPFLSLRPPRASEAARPLAPLASREHSTSTPREHLLQGKCEVLHGSSFSHHSQAAFVSCFVSFLIWLC